MSMIRMSSVVSFAAMVATTPALAQNAPYAGCDPKPAPYYAPSPGDDQITARAKAIHAKTFTIDTHVDIGANSFRVGQANYCNRSGSQVDLIKMEEGGLGGAFFSIYVGHGLLDSAGFARSYGVDTTLFQAVHRFAEQLAPDRVAIAYSAADAKRIHASGKVVAFMGVENGEGIGNDITRVKEFYDRGGRYMSFSHNGHSQLSDSNTGEANDKWDWGNGISPMGKKVLTEMNRLGMMIDISHPSKGAMMQILALTKAPIIASHSGVRALCNHSRNLDDEQLKALAKNGGVAQIVAFKTYVNCNPKADSARTAETNALYQDFSITPPAGRGGGGGRGAGGGAAGGGAAGGGRGGAAGAAGGGGNAAAGGGRGAGGGNAAAAGGRGGGGGGGGGRGASAGGACGGATAQVIAGGGLGFGAARGGAPTAPAGLSAVDSQVAALPEARQIEFLTRQQAIAQKYPATPAANVMDFVDHIDYAVRMMGIDHVGISSDFDGGGGVEGFNCAVEAINVTKELVRRGYSETDIGKIWSGNLLRVMAKVELVAKQLKAAPKK